MTKELTVYEKTYEAIKSMILHLEMRPGDRITESMITAKFNFSRSPIREALRQLESEGLVTLHPNKGAEVVAYSPEQVRQIGAMRLDLDFIAARLALYYGSDADFDNLVQYVEACEQGAKSGDIYRRIQTDIAFHLKITDIAKNSPLMKLHKEIYTQIHLIQIAKYDTVENSLAEIRHHRDIVEALKRRDMVEITVQLCDHVGEFYGIEPHIIHYYLASAAEKN